MKLIKKLSDGFDLNELENIGIISEYESNRVAVQIGLICTLYVSNPHQSNVRSKLAVCGDQYLEMFSSELRLFQDPWGKGKMKPYPAKGYSLSESLVDFVDNQTPFTPSFTGAKNARDASLYSMSITAPGTEFFNPGEVAGSITATFPISSVLDCGNSKVSKKIQELVLDWCQTIQPESGYVGLGFIQSIDWGERLRTIRQVSVMASQFLGLDVDNPDIIGNHVSGRIKGVNWLTIVSHKLIESIGGKVALENLQKVNDVFQFSDYGTGLIIQAGNLPQVGDSIRRHELEPYRTIAQLLKPLRLKFPNEDALLDIGDGHETELTNKWLGRFE